MTEREPVVFVVDDDPSMCRSLANLLRSAGWRVQTYSSADDYLQGVRPDAPSCLVLDVRLPGRSGLDLQRELAQADTPPPIVFVTGHGDISMAVHAIQGGAIEFLTKPFREQDLLDAIRRAIDLHRDARRKRAELADLQQRLDLLTPREREVLLLVLAGLLNKQIAAKLGLSEATVKAHRGQVMQKLRAGSVAELVTMGVTLGVVPAGS